MYPPLGDFGSVGPLCLSFSGPLCTLVFSWCPTRRTRPLGPSSSAATLCCGPQVSGLPCSPCGQRKSASDHRGRRLLDRVLRAPPCAEIRVSLDRPQPMFRYRMEVFSFLLSFPLHFVLFLARTDCHRFDGLCPGRNLRLYFFFFSDFPLSALIPPGRSVALDL